MANQSKSLSPNGNGLANGSLSSSPEKPLHYTYLKGFRVEQCALFLQHKCTNHKPFTCFDWHFQNQRRRRPVRRRDGTFNYSPDTYCTKYDETTGICSNKDDCPYLHKTAGDTERRYHLRYYKTGICVYETDSRGYCSKNGKHCAFAHGAQDLRNPVFDVRELQTLDNGNSSGELMEAACGNSSLTAGTSIASTSIDRERNALLEDPRWNETAYVLANYKTVLCKRPPRFCRQGYACPQYHNGKDRRRSPKIFKYRSTPCPNTKQGDEWVDPSKCEQGDQCPYCHSRTEQQFHPEIFKSTKCKDIQDTGYCPRGAFCAFAHTEDEMVATRDIDLDKLDLVDEAQSEMSSSYPGENLLARSYNQAQEELNKSLEQMRQPAFNNLSSNNVDDDDDIFSSSEMRRLSNRNDNIILGSQDSSSETNSIVNNLLGIDPVIKPSSKNLGPIARPRSYSHSQARTVNTDFNQLHAALARARMIDELKMAQTFAVNNDYSSNLIGFRERAVHSFSISSATPPVSALDFLPSSRLTPSNLTLDDLTGNNSIGNQSKSLSPNGNGLANGSLSSSPEKPLHYTYLKGFRVEQCALFLQHKCTNHKPFTCFDWHFQNQRRRRPVRRRDGTFNYSPDTYCTKYDETTGICSNKDDCPYLHKTAGDTERRYHLRYYKTGICVYETDSRGYCSKNGKHCAFAHGAQDLRNPVFDVRELQTLDNGNSSGELSDTACLTQGTSVASTSIDRERNALLEDPRWNETAYVLANYKTVLCKRPPRFCRQGYACPQYHNGKDRRRSPKIFKYRSTPCPNTKQGDEWVDPSKCEQGDQCPYCHSRTEQQFHPEIFKSTKCKDIQDTGYCPRGAFCAFAHTEDEMVATRDIDLDKLDFGSSRAEMSQSYPGESLLARNYQANEELNTLGSQLNRSLERMRPFNNLDDDDDDDIFRSRDMRRLSDRNDNIILGAQDSNDADTIVNNLLGIESVIRNLNLL